MTARPPMRRLTVLILAGVGLAGLCAAAFLLRLGPRLAGGGDNSDELKRFLVQPPGGFRGMTRWHCKCSGNDGVSTQPLPVASVVQIVRFGDYAGGAGRGWMVRGTGRVGRGGAGEGRLLCGQDGCRPRPRDQATRGPSCCSWRATLPQRWAAPIAQAMFNTGGRFVVGSNIPPNPPPARGGACSFLTAAPATGGRFLYPEEMRVPPTRGAWLPPMSRCCPWWPMWPRWVGRGRSTRTRLTAGAHSRPSGDEDITATLAQAAGAVASSDPARGHRSLRESGPARKAAWRRRICVTCHATPSGPATSARRPGMVAHCQGQRRLPQ